MVRFLLSAPELKRATKLLETGIHRCITDKKCFRLLLSSTAIPPVIRKHCSTCSCETTEPITAPCAISLASDDSIHLPPPLAEPLYSVRRRLLDTSVTTPLSSPPGIERLQQSLTANTAASYIPLTQHATNQSEPAYCGLTTACIVLNALECDTVYRWNGGWRYWHDESVLFAACPCLDPRRIQRQGISIGQLQQLLVCQGLRCRLYRPPGTGDDEQDGNSLDSFRDHVQRILANPSSSVQKCLVVSFARAPLGQTGDGHFSPVAAYHAPSDSVLVLDVARYKYPPYWVPLEILFDAMQHVDSVTGRSRGWLLIEQQQPSQSLSEERRPVQYVPLVGKDDHPCPVHPIKVKYCPRETEIEEPPPTKST